MNVYHEGADSKVEQKQDSDRWKGFSPVPTEAAGRNAAS